MAKIFQWWYKDCLVQNIWMVLAAIMGVFLAVISTSLVVIDWKKVPAKTPQQIASKKIIVQHKWRIASAMVVSFLTSFVINNIILTYYCGQGFKGISNLGLSLAIFFLLVPLVNYLVGLGISYVILGDIIKELNALKNL